MSWSSSLASQIHRPVGPVHCSLRVVGRTGFCEDCEVTKENTAAAAAAARAAWSLAAAKSAPGGDLNSLNWVTPDGITVKPLYTARDTRELPYVNTLPGFEPYIRGPQATMYAARAWTIRQYAGFSTAEESN